MKKKCIKKTDYKEFLNSLEKYLTVLMKKYDDVRKGDSLAYNSSYLCGWDDGAFVISQTIRQQIRNFINED